MGHAASLLMKGATPMPVSVGPLAIASLPLSAVSVASAQHRLQHSRDLQALQRRMLTNSETAAIHFQTNSAVDSSRQFGQTKTEPADCVWEALGVRQALPKCPCGVDDRRQPVSSAASLGESRNEPELTL